MCTITLSYNENDQTASEKLAALLSTGLFVKVNQQEELDIDYSDASLYEDDPSLKLDKESYTPEELRTMLTNDLNQNFGVKNAL